MKTFDVVYRSPDQRGVVRKRLEGHAEALVRRDLESQGNQVLAILPVATGGIRGVWAQIRSGKSLPVPALRFGVSTTELALFCEVLKALYSSGVPMLQSLQIIIDETPNPWFRKRLGIVLERLRDGVNIHEAMSDPGCRGAFPSLMRETIRTGEANGRLDKSLERLAEIFKRAADTKRETISATMYPALALLMFFVVSTVIAVMVPEALRQAVGSSDISTIMPRLDPAIRLLFFLEQHPAYLVLPPSAIAAMAGLWMLGKRYHATRVALTRVERKVPLIGPVIYQFALVRFLDLLASNNESGIQIAESLRLIQGSVNDVLIEDSLGRMRDRILTAGTGLGQAIANPEESGVFPGLVRQMVRAGEESGRLTEMLLPIVAFYGDHARAMLKRMLDMLTPVMIILLGLVIGPVVVGLYKALIILQDVYAAG